MKDVPPKKEIIGQAFTVFYQWTRNPGQDNEFLGAAMMRLFRLLKDLDEDAHSAVFRAARKDEDFPQTYADKYPLSG